MEQEGYFTEKRESLPDYIQKINPVCPGWGPPSVTYSSEHLVSYISGTRNLPDHRSRPLDLIGSPTYMPPQTEMEVQIGRMVRRDVPQATYWCPDIQSLFKITRDLYQDVTPPDFLSAFPTVDWSLDMRMKIADQALNIGSSIAEYKEAGTMFLQLASALHKTYQSLRRGKFNRFLKEYGSLKNIAAIHLMNDFGIQPLCHDLGAGVAALSGKAEKPLVRRYVVTKKDHIDTYAGGYKGVAKTSVRAIAYVTYDTGFGPINIGNPLEWAWELIPFSFVVDWAFPIGDWLGALDAMTGVNSTIGTVTTKREYRHDYIGDPAPYIMEKDAFMTFKSHSRDVIHDIPTPPFPKYEPSDSFRNVAQGLSLLTVIHRGP